MSLKRGREGTETDLIPIVRETTDRGGRGQERPIGDETTGGDTQALQVSQVDAIVIIDNPIGEGPGRGATAEIATGHTDTIDATGDTNMIERGHPLLHPAIEELMRRASTNPKTNLLKTFTHIFRKRTSTRLGTKKSSGMVFSGSPKRRLSMRWSKTLCLRPATLKAKRTCTKTS